MKTKIIRGCNWYKGKVSYPEFKKCKICFYKKECPGRFIEKLEKIKRIYIREI